MCCLLFVGSSCELCRMEDATVDKYCLPRQSPCLLLKQRGRSSRPFRLVPVPQCGCWSLISEKAVDDSAALVFAVACRLFRSLFSGHHAGMSNLHVANTNLFDVHCPAVTFRSVSFLQEEEQLGSHVPLPRPLPFLSCECLRFVYLAGYL